MWNWNKDNSDLPEEDYSQQTESDGLLGGLAISVNLSLFREETGQDTSNLFGDGDKDSERED